MTDDERRERTYHALKKTRELLRDMLWLKYENEWRKRDRWAGTFFDPPSGDVQQFMEFIMAFADGDEYAVKCVAELK